MIRRRHLLYVLAALAVPIPAFAVGVGTGTPQPQPLDVAVSLDECGIASTTVVCKLDATFNSIDGARYYTAAVTGPDGSVVDYGNVSSGATSLWVPYVGDGTYSVTVSAWGEIVKHHKPKPLATDSANTAGANHRTTATPGAGHGHTHHAGVATHAATPGRAGQGDGAPASTPSTPASPVRRPACPPRPSRRPHFRAAPRPGSPGRPRQRRSHEHAPRRLRPAARDRGRQRVGRAVDVGVGRAPHGDHQRPQQVPRSGDDAGRPLLPGHRQVAPAEAPWPAGPEAR